MARIRKFPSIMQTIHNNNHTNVIGACKIQDPHINPAFDIITKIDYIDGHEYKNIDPGIYKIGNIFNVYVFDIFDEIDSSGSLVINDIDNSYFDSNGEVHYITMYKLAEYVTGNEIYLDNTINDNVDIMVIHGKSSLVNGCISNLTRLEMSSFNNDNSETDTLSINFDEPLKSLPFGTKDIMILNCKEKQYHIIYRVGQMALTSALDWICVTSLYPHNDDYHIFHHVNRNIACGNNKENMIISDSIFEVDKLDVLLSRYTNKNCIATDIMNGGLYLKIEKSILDNYVRESNIEKLIAYLDDLSSQGKTPIINYPLSHNVYRKILLDDYTLKTYQGCTRVVSNCEVSYCYKTLYI